MKLLPFLFTLLSLFGFSQYDTLVHDGLERSFMVYVPSAYTGDSSVSLIIAMHGGFGSANNLQNQSQLSIKADTANFIVVYPEGIQGGLLGIRAWNAGWCCGYPSNNNIDDVGFIDQLIDTMLIRYNIDSTRIYATGMSNGGFMAYRLACELPHRIAAIAPVAASLSMSSCQPQRPVPLISFHSYQDSNVPYEGGVGNGTSNHYNSPQDSVMDGWAQMNNCQSNRDTLHSGSDYTEIQWRQCSCETEVKQIVTEDGGHSWPGGNGTVVGDAPSQVIDANHRMWNFFLEHNLDCPSLASTPKIGTQNALIYPNPVADYLHLPFQLKEVKIIDLQGRKIWEGQATGIIDVRFLETGSYLLLWENQVYRFEKK